MKKWILLISLPLLLIALLLAISFYIYPNIQQQRDNDTENNIDATQENCIESSTVTLPEEIKSTLKSSCITEHTTNETQTNIVLIPKDTTYPEILYALRQTDWKISNVEEDGLEVVFTLGNRKLVLSRENENVYILLETVQTSTPSDTNTAKPKPTPVESPSSKTEYTVTSTEISKISTTQKVIVFTFDGGAGIQSLDRILTILENHNVKGTFFVTGKWADQQSTSLKKISNAGHEIFNHTYSHPNLTTLSDSQIREELSLAESKISAVTGRTTKPFYRPPYGARDSRVREVAANAGYQTVYWTVDALDWKESEGITEQEVKNRILNNVTPGTIYLMHIGDNITGNILDEVFVEIESRGYQIKSLSEVLIKN